MKALLIAAATAAAIAAAATPIAASAQFISIGPNGFGIYMYGGHRYCWYDEGWRGSGWYWCGYANRRGYGWGGGEGWRNWDRYGGRRDRDDHDRGHDRDHDRGDHGDHGRGH